MAGGGYFKDASGLVGHRPPSSLQTALPSTSQPVNPGPVKGTPVTTKGNTVVEHAVNTFAILDSSALDEDAALPIGSKGTPPGSSLGNKYALGLREDVLDGTNSENVVLPDDLFDVPPIGGVSLVAEIAEDFSVAPPQLSTSPHESVSKKGKGKGGGKVPPTTKGGGAGWGKEG